MIDSFDILEPKDSPSLSNYDILYGKPIDPLQKLAILDDSEFEDIILEWIHGYLKKRYISIRKCAGAGDKGRDIIAKIDNLTGKWDNYQCKHYGNKLTPTNFYLELGKLCYYTHINDFKIPNTYYIVSREGVGTKLGDLIDNPDNLKAELIVNWDGYVKDKITAIPIELDGELKTYINNFDFSIIKSIEPHEFIEQFQKTQWYSYRFGGVIKQRDNIPLPDLTDSEKTLRYVTQLLAVYSEEISQELDSIEELSAYGNYKIHFDIQRKNFYSVESLKQFERDNLPPDSKAFDNLKDIVLAVVYNKIFNQYRNSFEKVNDILGHCSLIDMSSSPLAISISVQDKQGICHHLVNENKLTWIEGK